MDGLGQGKDLGTLGCRVEGGSELKAPWVSGEDSSRLRIKGNSDFQLSHGWNLLERPRGQGGLESRPATFAMLAGGPKRSALTCCGVQNHVWDE